ncbi:MAG: site-2 protease family protein [Sedimentisphaerales bacterium]|nr:site-2 protease family protein [Sedimentisphaerales bacterium]
MSEKKSPSFKKPVIITLIIVAAIWFLFFRNSDSFASSIPVIINILIVAVGFGAVIMIHEFGHFIVAKIGGIKVEAFSIGFPPTFIGIQKKENGIRFRILPKFFPKNTGDPDDDGFIFTIPGKHKPSDTEYRISLLPFGGFVKMLGQDDTGSVEASNDPRSFANKPVSIRIAVAASGIVFNAISAVLIFMIVFLIGVDLMPAVVGQVRPNSPAQIAGIKPQDRIIEIDGETFVDFLSYSMTTMLSEKAKPIHLKIQRPDGDIEEMTVVAEDSKGALLPGKDIGIIQAKTLNIASGLTSSDVKYLYETTGLKPGDKVIAFDSMPVRDSWELDKLVQNALKSSCTLTIERIDPDTKKINNIDISLPLSVDRVNDNFETGFDIAHIYSIIPRLKIVTVQGIKEQKTFKEKVISIWKNKVLKQPVPEKTELTLEKGDIILQAANTINPTFEELHDITNEHAEKPLQLKVLRKNDQGIENSVDITVTPRIIEEPSEEYPAGKAIIGFLADLDVEHPVVADTIDIKNGPSALDIPKGAIITKVDGQEVASFYDIIEIIRKSCGQKISIDYVTADGKDAGGTGILVPSKHDYISVKTGFEDAVPFDYLKENFKADNPIQAVIMGLKKTKMFIVNSYLTLKGLMVQSVKKEAISGPVGIVTISYKIAASQSLTYYAYFMGLVSSCLAFMNLLPIPIVDGGVIVLLIIEKIKGSPLSLRIQETISYVGLAFIITLFVWLTYNDITNLILHW